MPYRPKTGLREECEDENSRWSEWLHIMSPDKCYGWHKRSEDHPGFRRPKIDNNIQDTCGIYELGMSKNERNPVVVYIGKSCRGQIAARINEYSYDGSHKADFIDEAIDRGYDIYVRYMLLEPEAVKEAEEKYLKSFDYAWNKMLNGDSRDYYP